MSENSERSECEWSKHPMAESGPLLVGDDATEEPRDFVALVSRRPCGANGQLIYVINRHGSQRIFVTVRTRWVYQNQPRSRTETYPLEPGGEAEVGCTVPGPTSQRFDRDITGARFG
jgi:hypothetical protein